MNKLSELDVQNNGGVHFATVREWILWNCINGDSIKWGSDEHISISVKDLELLSCSIATSVLNNVLKKYPQLNKEQLLLSLLKC